MEVGEQCLSFHHESLPHLTSVAANSYSGEVHRVQLVTGSQRPINCIGTPQDEPHIQNSFTPVQNSNH